MSTDDCSFAAYSWKRLAHLLAAYEGIAFAHQAYFTRAFCEDFDLLYKATSADDQQPPAEQAAQNRGDPYENDEKVESTNETSEAIEPVESESVDNVEEFGVDLQAKRLESVRIAGDEMTSGRTEKPCESEDDELKRMAEMGFPTNFSTKRPRKSNKRERFKKFEKRAQRNADTEAGNRSTGADNVDEPGATWKAKRTDSGEEYDEENEEDQFESHDDKGAEKSQRPTEDLTTGKRLKKFGPKLASYEWVKAEFEKHWEEHSRLIIWRNWIEKFGQYMTEDTWSSMDAEVLNDPEVQRLRQKLAESLQEPPQLPDSLDWNTEWEQNETDSYWGELLAFSKRYRVNKSGLEILAQKLGFEYEPKIKESISNSCYTMMPAYNKKHKAIIGFVPDMDDKPAAPEETGLADPKLNRYWNQRYRYFDRLDEGIEMDAEAIYSVTPQRIGRHQAERLQTMGVRVVVDAFCGVGGNAVQFAELCDLVLAVEMNPERLGMALHNAGVYGVQRRVSAVCGDFFAVLPALARASDAVFLSPPWGGPDYMKSSVFNLDEPVLSGNRSVADCLQFALRHCANVAVYLPRNTDVGQLTRLLARLGQRVVEIEQNMLNGRFKAITVYTGALIDTSSQDY